MVPFRFPPGKKIRLAPQQVDGFLLQGEGGIGISQGGRVGTHEQFGRVVTENPGQYALLTAVQGGQAGGGGEHFGGAKEDS